jgi:colicin import membrane protein
MTLSLHHPHTTSPSLNRFITLSFVAHIVVLIGLSLTLPHSIRIAPAPAIQVKLIGVPQPTSSAKPDVKPEKIRTQDSAAPKEPPPEMKRIPPSEAKTKFLTDPPPEATPDKANPMDAKERPPVLDKNPLKKKVVKNDLDAKVVKNPEDFLKALDFVDKLEKQNANPVPKTQASEKPAGEGPQLQLNMADNGVVSAIQGAINKNWLFTPGADTRNLSVTVFVRLDAQGNLTFLQITRPSGNPSFDLSLERAIRKTVPLPIPADKMDKFRELELTFQAPQ